MLTHNIPKHVAIIMDGNGRWAKQHKQARWKGHQAGARRLTKVLEIAAQANVEVLSLFAFSSENWKRPKKEIDQLKKIFAHVLQHQVDNLMKNNIQLHIVGDLSKFSRKIQTLAHQAIQSTANNTGLKLVIALNYGGRWDIVQAAKRIVKGVVDGKIQEAEIDESLFSQYLSLSMSALGDPDLLIRTSGEERISNFFLWQLAYTELYFTDVLWPDFDEATFQDALTTYASRKRRFGKTE